MWAYGTDKDLIKSISALPYQKRKPSHGIKRIKVPKPDLKIGEVLVRVKASSLNYNSIWSSLCYPISPQQLISRHVQRNKIDTDHLNEFAIFGSDAAGIVEEVGPNELNWTVGDEVIIHCNVVELNDPIVQKDGLLTETQSIWGYETNYGAFAEFTKVRSSQLIKKPKHLSWEIAASFCLALSTSYRMLISENGSPVRPLDNCLVWGAAGGLGTFAVQLIRLVGGNPIAVVSSKQKSQLIKKLGASVVIERNKEIFGDFCAEDGSPNYLSWRKAQSILKNKGIKRLDCVFDHVGRDTIPVSLFLLSRGGVVTTCAASSGYMCNIDLRYLWMSVKKIIGCHIANYEEAVSAANLVFEGKINPVIFDVVSIEQLPKMADLLFSNKSYGKIVFTHD